MSEVFVLNPSSGGGGGGTTVTTVPTGTQNVTGTTTNVPSGTQTTQGSTFACAAADIATPATNTAAIVTYSAAGGTLANYVTGVAWSYSGTPTGGNLVMTDNSVTVFSVDITAAGPGVFVFPYPKKGVANAPMAFTLAAGGSGIAGKVSVLNHWTA